MPDGGRWLTVAPPGGAVAVALTTGDGVAVGVDTGIRLVAARRRARSTPHSTDAASTSTRSSNGRACRRCSRFRDVDGNTLYVVEAVAS